MKTLVICRPAAGIGREQLAPHAGEELAAVSDLHRKGLLLEAYSPGGPGAILIFDGEVDQVTQALESLPMARDGLIEGERIELHPFQLD